MSSNKDLKDKAIKKLIKYRTINLREVEKMAQPTSKKLFVENFKPLADEKKG
jgi:hypothetical protein